MEFNDSIKIIHLGGVGEVGKNMILFIYRDDILVVDGGLAFPDEDQPGIDMVIPDITFLEEHQDKIRGIVLTHGHEDHIGAMPYILDHIDAPVYGTRLTLGLLKARLSEQEVKVHHERLHQVKPRDRVKIGAFDVEFIRVNHSIADTVGLALHTPLGTIVHSGDFKLDQTPVDREVIDLHKFAELGDHGVLLLLSDSTNADRSGFTLSERVVGQALRDIFLAASGRIILATFASNVHRIQQVIDAAAADHRRVVVAGESMKDTVRIAMDLGYITDRANTLMKWDEQKPLTDDRVVIVTTGTQGEPMSALTRMDMGEHSSIQIMPGDTVVLAATPITGNEKLISRTVDRLYQQGAHVIHDAASGVHVSGHASREELKLMLNLVRPRYLVPIHGEYRHLVHHADIAEDLGMPRENVFVMDVGDVLEISPRGKAAISGKVPSGKVLVDGLGVGDVGNVVLRDRRQLAQDGILIATITMDARGKLVSGPDIMSRGFVYVRESEQLMEDARERIRQALSRLEGERQDWGTLKSTVRDTLGKYLYEKTRRRPMILPIVMEIEE